MKRRDDLVVGGTVLAALITIIAGAIWLSESQLGQGGDVYIARFRSVGGLGVGDPVVLRGVRVGRVKAIRLGQSNWVEAELQIYDGVSLPARPAIIAASASLFGEWQAGIVPLDQPLDDPNVQRDLEAALREGTDAWPGATLPDIGQLTAQAGRIATDIASVSSRFETVFDSQAVSDLQQSIRDFGRVSDRLTQFTQQQTEILGDVGANLQQGSDVLADAARSLSASLARVDSATNQGQLVTILNNTQQASEQIGAAATDFRSLVAAARANQASLIRIIEGADSVMTRMRDRTGTLGLLVSDSTLYLETTRTVAQLRQLLADIQANPRKYFRFSVF
ncbi:MAG TPA: MlaD family protein [Gemmatimonadales bacterium]|nr:MlaD family protein [Gemmatimonadales bacterium]